MTPKVRPEVILTLLDLLDDALPTEAATEACAALSNDQLADLLDAYLWATRADSALLAAISLRLRV